MKTRGRLRYRPLDVKAREADEHGLDETFWDGDDVYYPEPVPDARPRPDAAPPPAADLSPDATPAPDAGAPDAA